MVIIFIVTWIKGVQKNTTLGHEVPRDARSLNICCKLLPADYIYFCFNLNFVLFSRTLHQNNWSGRSYQRSCVWADSHSHYSRSSLLASPVSPASPVLASSYIVGGVVVRANSHPYMAALYVGEKHFCGGSLLTPLHVLTAAHCVAGLSPAQANKLLVRLGRHHVYQSQAHISSVTTDLQHLYLFGL